MTLLYDFGGLLPEQRAIMAEGGWKWQRGVSLAEPADDIINPLVTRGLLLVQHSHTRSVLEGGERRGSVRRTFSVPGPVASAWRAFVATERGATP